MNGWSERTPNMNKEDNILLKRIVNHLILHASFTDDVGLFHGKMGIILFFAHYARYTGNHLFDDFAGELLNEVYENVTEALPINLESGLCGIGWGTGYLIQNGFLEGNADEILKEIDHKIMEQDLKRMKDRSLPTGLLGIGCYIDQRLCVPRKETEDRPFDDTYLTDWKTVSSSLEIVGGKKMLDSLLEKQPVGDKFLSWDLGLVNGCAGYGLKKIGI